MIKNIKKPFLALKSARNIWNWDVTVNVDDDTADITES